MQCTLIRKVFEETQKYQRLLHLLSQPHRKQSYVRNETASQVFESIDEQYTNKYEDTVGEITSAEIKSQETIPAIEYEEPKQNPYWDRRQRSTALKDGNAEPKISNEQKKWDDNTLYSQYKEVTGYNEFSSSVPLYSKNQHYRQNIWAKKYVRDLDGKSVLPQRFKDIDQEEFRKYMRKADHHFFSEKVPPKQRVYRPLTHVGWREKRKNDSESDKDNEGKEVQDEEIERTAEKLKKLTVRDEVQIKNINANIKHLEYKDTVNQTTEDLVGKFLEDTNANISLRVQRILEWQRFLMRMRYVQKLVTKRVTCVRAIGRVNQTIVLFLMGDGEGYFTYGIGKGTTQKIAYRRAQYNCRKNALYIPQFEGRTFFQDAYQKFGRSHVRIYSLPRGAGLTCSQRYQPWLRAVGVQDGGMKLSGTRNQFNVMQAFIKCLEKQRSYREIAFARGVDYRNIRSPFNQTPPVPSPQEVVELERQASENLRTAIHEVMHKRGLLYTKTFEPLKPTLLDYDPTAYKEAWDKHLDRKNVPHGVRLYPGFSDFVDASTYIASIPMGIDVTQQQEPQNSIPNLDRPHRDIFGLHGVL